MVYQVYGGEMKNTPVVGKAGYFTYSTPNPKLQVCTRYIPRNIIGAFRGKAVLDGQGRTDY